MQKIFTKIINANSKHKPNDLETLSLFNSSCQVPANHQVYAGFTLSEVLITLAIIGIVAALTIPSLIANTKKAQYLTGLKKAYSEWSQALNQMATDSGCPGDLGCFIDTGDLPTIGDKVVTYFKVTKNCRTAQGCWTTSMYTHLDKSGGISNYSTEGYRFSTADGMNVLFGGNLSKNCQSYQGAKMSKACSSGQLYIDINGNKEPNIMGRDIFNFTIDNTRGPKLASVYSWVKGTNTCVPENGSASVATDGWTCTARIIYQGWQMNY